MTYNLIKKKKTTFVLPIYSLIHTDMGKEGMLLNEIRIWVLNDTYRFFIVYIILVIFFFKKYDKTAKTFNMMLTENSKS